MNFVEVNGDLYNFAQIKCIKFEHEKLGRGEIAKWVIIEWMNGDVDEYNESHEMYFEAVNLLKKVRNQI